MTTAVKDNKVQKKEKPVDAWGLIDAPFFYETPKVGVWLGFLTSRSAKTLEMSGMDGENLTLIVTGPNGCCAILKTQFKKLKLNDREELIKKVEKFPDNSKNPVSMRKRKSDALYSYLTFPEN